MKVLSLVAIGSLILMKLLFAKFRMLSYLGVSAYFHCIIYQGPLQIFTSLMCSYAVLQQKVLHSVKMMTSMRILIWMKWI